MTDKERRRPEDCIGDMLRAIYGEIHQHEKIYLGTKPDDYRGKPFHSDLSLIYYALEKHRDFRDFVQAPYVTPDFFIPNPGFVVECDESQHFTKPRKISLEKYPNDKNLGFMKEQWISLCEELDKHDNDPPSRDEKRAWYDTLRDFLPEIKGFGPTVRLYYKEMDWCRMDPNKEADRDTFKRIISERQSQTKIEVIVDPNPKFARVIIKDPWEGNLRRAKSLMEDIIQKWPDQDRVEFFVTPGAFLRFPWPEHFSAPEDNLHPSSESLNLLRDAARKHCDLFLDENLRTALAEHADYLTIGIDSTDERQRNGYQVEFVALVDLKTNQYFWTGKSYPDSPQEHRLIRVSDLSSHFIQIPLGKVLVLGCHDLKMFSNRGRTSAARVQENTWRKTVHQEIDQLVAREKPVVILQHPHTTDRYGSWYAEWNELSSHCPSDVSYISSGLYHYYGKHCRSSLTDVRNYTRHGPSLDFIVHLNSANIEHLPLTKDLSEKKMSPSDETKVSFENRSRYRPEFDNLIEVYKQMAGPAFQKGGTSSNENYIVKMQKTPPGVVYYLCDFPEKGKFSVELNVNESRAPEYESTIRTLSKKQFDALPQSNFWEQKTKNGTWLRLQFFYPDNSQPAAVVQGMFDLIKQSYPEIHRTIDESQSKA